MIIDELNKKIADIESLANDKTSSIESKVSDLTDGLLMVADAVDIIPEMVDEKITAITKEFSTIKDSVSKVKAQKGDKGDRGEPGIDGIGIKGDDGKDGSPDTGEQIVDKINELEGVLDTKVLKDFSMPDVKDLERQINTIGNQTLRLLSRPTTTTSSSFTGVTTDATLTGLGTDTSPLSVVATSASDVAVTVRAATTAALAGTWTYDNGTSGVGATLTRTTNGVLPNQDGISLSDGDRFLIKNQASTLANGVYVLTQKGVASVSPTIFTRATDADETSELDELVVTISEGSTNRGTVWGQQTNNPTVGTSAIVFATVVSTAVTQATSGTQAINQIPTLTGTARQITRGTANFKYNPTNDLFTIRGVDYTFPANNGDASQVLTTDGSGTLSWTTPSGGGTPAGSDTNVQFNDSGAFGGINLYTFDKAGGFKFGGIADGSTFLEQINGTKVMNYGFNFLNQGISLSGSGTDSLTVGTPSGVAGTYEVIFKGEVYVTLDVNATITGTFENNEVLTGGTSGATAKFIVYSSDDSGYIKMYDVSGAFTVGETVTGGTSGATWVVGAGGVNAVSTSDEFAFIWNQNSGTYIADIYSYGDGFAPIGDITILMNGPYGDHVLNDTWTITYAIAPALYGKFDVPDSRTLTWGDVSNEFSGVKIEVGINSGNIVIGDVDNIGNGTKITIDDVNESIELNVGGSTYQASDIPKSIKVSVSSAEILSLNTTPKELIPAPGAGKYIDIISAQFSLTYGTTDYSYSPSPNDVTLTYGTNQCSGRISLNASTTTFQVIPIASVYDISTNTAVNFYCSTGNPTSGDSTVDIYLTYRVVTL